MTVVFDVGGVLIRIAHTWREAAARAGLEQLPSGLEIPLTDLTAFQLHQAGQLGDEAYLRSLGDLLGGIPPEVARRVHDAILMEEMDGVSELVDGLRAEGVACGLLSNTNSWHWSRIISEDHFPASSGCPLRMASHLVALEKPDPAIFELYAATFRLPPEEIVFFDDSLPNVKAARKLGWQAYAIDPRADTAAQMKVGLEHHGVLPPRG